MRPIPVSDLPQHIIDKMSPEDRKENNVMSTEEWGANNADKAKQREEKAERVIQNEVESYLVHLGYERRSPEDIKRGMPRSGYQIHLYATKKNPILCDLLILSHSGKYLELELKTAKGATTAEQECLIVYGSAKLARSSEEAITIIREWHEHEK